MDAGMFDRLLAPIRRRLRLAIARGVVNLVNDAAKMQELQISVLQGEVAGRAERFQQYGFTGVPLQGAECVALSINGSRGHTVVIAVDDRRYRLKGLANGEVAVYTDEGDFVWIKRGGTTHVKAATKVYAETPLFETSGNAKVGGNLQVMGNTQLMGTFVVEGTSNLKGATTIQNKVFLTHGHTNVTVGGGTSGPVA